MDINDLHRNLRRIEAAANIQGAAIAARIAARARHDLENGGSPRDAANLLKTAEWALRR